MIVCPCCNNEFKKEWQFASHVDDIADPERKAARLMCWCMEGFWDYDNLIEHLESVEDLETHYIIGMLGNRK